MSSQSSCLQGKSFLGPEGFLGFCCQPYISTLDGQMMVSFIVDDNRLCVWETQRGMREVHCVSECVCVCVCMSVLVCVCHLWFGQSQALIKPCPLVPTVTERIITPARITLTHTLSYAHTPCQLALHTTHGLKSSCNIIVTHMHTNTHISDCGGHTTD